MTRPPETAMTAAKYEHEPPHLLLMPDPDLRDRSDPAYVEYRDTVLRPSIRQDGIRVPVLAFLRPDGRKQVFEGGTRLEAARLEQMETVPVLTYPAVPEDLDEATYTANAHRKDWTPAEEGRYWSRAMREKGWTAATLCRRLRVKQAKVSKRFRWMDEGDGIPAAFHDKVGSGDGMLPERAAYEICSVPPEQRADLCQRFLDGRMTLEALAILRKRGGKKREPRVKLRCGGVSAVISGGLEAAKLFAQKLADAIKRIERDGGGPDCLPGLVR